MQKAVAALKGKFEQVRERPADVARELKTQTIDLIKYEKLGEYRAYVCSEHFVADTRRLVKEDMPSLAKEATRLGAHGVKAGAELMKEGLATRTPTLTLTLTLTPTLTLTLTLSLTLTLTLSLTLTLHPNPNPEPSP